SRSRPLGLPPPPRGRSWPQGLRARSLLAPPTTGRLPPRSPSGSSPRSRSRAGAPPPRGAPAEASGAELRPQGTVVRDVVADVAQERAAGPLPPEVPEEGAVEVEDVRRSREAVLRRAGQKRDLVVVGVGGDRRADLRGVGRHLEAERAERVEDPVARGRLGE